MRIVKKTADNTNNGHYKNRWFFVLITLDIKNMFNSTPWRSVVDKLVSKDISKYLLTIVKSNLSDRKLLIGE